MVKAKSYKEQLRPLQNPHPGLDLARVVTRFLNLNDRVGAARKFSRRELMEKLGFEAKASGAANTLVSALVHFGLLEKRGTDYIYSPLGEKLATTSPESEDYYDLLRQAALSPELYKWVYDQYGDDLPDGVSEKLIRKYRARNVNNGSVRQVLNNYKKTLVFAKVGAQDEVNNSDQTDEYVDVTFKSQTVSVYKRFLVEAIKRTREEELIKISNALNEK